MPPTERTIELSRPHNHTASLSTLLTPLSQTCKQLHLDMHTWYTTVSQLYAFTPTPLFGPLNLSLTQFTITVHHLTWSLCPCHTHSLLDASPLPCSSHLPYCPSRTLLALLTSPLSHLTCIRNLSLFFLAQDERQTPWHDNEHFRLQYNRNAMGVWNHLSHFGGAGRRSLEEVDVFVGWEATTRELRACSQLDLDIVVGGRVWVPVGGEMYVTMEREAGVEVRLWYLVEADGGGEGGRELRGMKQGWRVWPKGGAPVQSLDPRGCDDLDLIDMTDTMLVGAS